LAACSDDLPPPTYSGNAYDDVATLMQRTLNQRAVALETHDQTRFRRSLDRTDAGLLDSEQVYFDNLGELPVGRLRFRVVEDTITPVEGTDLEGNPEYWAEVVVALRLDGFDSAAVRTRDRFLFVPNADGSRLLVGSTTDYAWETDHPGNAQPWDLGRINVEREPGVLGIFDDWTADDAPAVMDAASAGRSDVRSVLGDAGAKVDGVVVYSLQDPTFLDGLAGQTVGDPDRADGLTIAVPVDALAPGKGVASYRIFVNPRVLYEPAPVVGRLVRHELTHALLGARGRGAPLWLSEGVAEYVSVRPMAPSQRRLPARALDVGATATDLPGEAEFGGADAEAWYAVSWWVCEYVAATYGQDVLFSLLDRLAGGADQAKVLPEVLGISSSQLAQRGVALMSTTYDG
jgi:hypothetical protein